MTSLIWYKNFVKIDSRETLDELDLYYIFVPTRNQILGLDFGTTTEYIFMVDGLEFFLLHKLVLFVDYIN